jgi:glycine/D-amino acid oxidase-like deaminating enzyme
MRATGHPVYHLAHLAHLAAPEPDAADDPFDPARFPVFTADVARTGWYGFPRHPRSGVLKIANHGVGVALDPARDERVVTDADIERARAFLADALPALANAPIPYTRRCLYCDTLDGHFVIDRHPRRPGLVVASGGSGHGFKFAPLVGDWIADVASGLAPIDRFRWRALDAGTRSQEAARHRGGDDDANDGGNDGDSDANDDNDGRDEGVP